MDNYICIHGNKVELTEEQIKQLGFEVKENPFKRVNIGEKYYFMKYNDEVRADTECDSRGDEECFKVANYCTDKSIMEQRALHETLNRLLWRYSMEHDGDKIDWDDLRQTKYVIYHDNRYNRYDVDNYNNIHWIGTICFFARNTAEAAIKEIIEPFMKEHPEFKW